MKSFTGKFTSVRGWTLLLALLLGAGMMISACGDEEVPAPTTPAPPPPAPPPAPEPEPEPEPPATPTGLTVSGSTASSVTWTWTAVEGALGYAVQVSMDEMFDDADQIAITQETSFTATEVAPETSVYLRVRSGTGTPEAVAAAVATGSLEGLLLSDWSTHVTGMTTAVPLAPAPVNLRVKERGSDFIVWEWDPVEGVDGYQSQFSRDEGFSDPHSAFHQAMNLTSRRVSLASETAGYLRVRTYTGALTDPTFGMWTEGSMSSTTKAVAVPLSAPTGLESDASDDSITLEWNRVRNAGSYEVEQREPGGDWGDADCGDGSNEVEDPECVAIGLTAGTEYDFQVRAVPSDTERYETSDWSDIEETRTSGTAPAEPTAPVGGGMGSLNVRWESDGTSITWIWDRIGGKTYDFKATPQAYEDDANPCANAFDGTPDTDFTSNSPATAYKLDNPSNAVALLCVRTHNEDDDDENLSFAWGVTTPVAPTRDDPAQRDNEKTGRTTALQWMVSTVQGGFKYEMRVVATPGSDTLPTAGPKSTQCASGALAFDGDSDVTLATGLDIAWSRNLQPFTRYSLCWRYENTAGRTDWGKTTFEHSITTLPAAPPRPVPDNALTILDSAAADGNRIVWTLSVRARDDVPRQGNRYEAKTLAYRERYSYDDNGTTKTSPVSISSSEVQAACNGEAVELRDGVNLSSVTGYVLSSAITPTNNPQGITVESGAFTAPDAGGDPDLDDLRVQLCVRVIEQTGTTPPFRAGHWVLSGVSEVKQKTE